MEKIWYIRLDNREEGPFTVEQLKRDHRITPDTLVWKQGFKKWIPIRKVPELKDIFKDEDETSKDQEEKRPSRIKKDYGEIVLSLEKDPFPYFLLWLIIVIIVLSYVFYQLRINN